MTKHTIRLNMTLTPEMRDLLDELKNRTLADTLAEVVRRSITVYDFVTNTKAANVKLILKTDDEEKEIVVI